MAPPSPIRGALAAGLLILFGLWLGSGYELLRNLTEGERRVNEMHAAFIRGEDSLTAIRTAVLLGSIYLRDALVDTTGSREYYQHELARFREDIEQRVDALAGDQVLSIDEAELRPLRAALDAYWHTLDLFLGPDAPTTFVQGTGVLRRQVVPARTNVLSVIDQLTDLQRTAERQREADASALYAAVRRRFVGIGAATLALGVIVSWFVLFRVGGMEREIEERRDREAQNRRHLERLSARLVDAQEQERRALSRELHDEFGQALTALKMEVGIALQAGGHDARVTAPLEEARAIAEKTLHGLRNLSQLLHPSILDDFGLPETLEAFVRTFSKRTDIRASLTVTGLESRLPAGVEVAVYRIVQEALTNVSRHSRATQCAVGIVRDADALTVTVEDDGIGVQGARDTPMPRGLGVVGMRERAQSLSGSFAMERREQGGTRVTVVIPLTRQAREATESVAG
jgi:signal transduction histidine kinase